MVDATKVSKIKIDTGYAGVREYSFFSKTSPKSQDVYDARCSVVYGRNGAGKSTITRALSINTNGTEFFDKDGNSLGGDCANVYVFNEAYVIKNFRIYDKDRLSPIILLGDYVQEVDDIDNLEDEISELEKEIFNLRENSFNCIINYSKFQEGQDLYMSMCKDFFWGLLENETAYVMYGDDFDYEENVRNIVSDDSLDHLGFNRWVSYKFHKNNRDVKHVGYFENVGEAERMMAKTYNEIYFELIKFSRLKDKSQGVNFLIRLRLLEDMYVRCVMYILYVKCRSLYDFIVGSFSLSRHDVKRYRDVGVDYLSKKKLLAEKTKNLQDKKFDDSGKQIVKRINQWLRMIFGEDLMEIESSGSLGYALKSKYGYISPDMLSLGEQNILALCYFFVEISAGKKLINSAHENQLIILDDPISSFDYNNKYGIVQVLDYIAGLMSKDGSETKIIIMTHDQGMALELSNSIKHRVGGKVLKCCEIVNMQGDCIKEVSFDNLDQYRNILKKMFDVATQNGKDIDLLSPNEVRRVWEAFLRFELGESKISDRSALNRVSCFYGKQSLEYKFLEAFMSYVYINQDSHSSDQMLFENFDLIPILGRHEFEKHIRQIILFMRLVAPHHIPSRLASKLKDITTYRDALEGIYKTDVLGQPKGSV